MDKDVAFDVINWKVTNEEDQGGRRREDQGGGRMRRTRPNSVSMFIFMIGGFVKP
jgi:hypothetical protein